MRLKKKQRNTMLYNELKARLISLLADDDESVNNQAGELILSLDCESLTDLMHCIFFEFEQLLVENQKLMDKLQQAQLLQERVQEHAQNTTRIGLELSEIPWNV